MAVTHSVAARNSLANQIDALINTGTGPAGTLRFNTATGAEVATCTFSVIVFGNATGGTITAASITDDTSAAGGTTTAAVLRDQNAATVVSCSVSATGGGGDIVLSNNVIGAASTVSVTSLTYSAPT